MGSKNHITILHHAYYYDIPTTSRHAEHIVACIGIIGGCGLGGVCDHWIITLKEIIWWCRHGGGAMALGEFCDNHDIV